MGRAEQPISNIKLRYGINIVEFFREELVANMVGYKMLAELLTEIIKHRRTYS